VIRQPYAPTGAFFIANKMKKYLAAVSLIAAMSPVHADDWGCEVLLCLANPAGPLAAAACVPPIKKLWRELARGHAFPTCLTAHTSNQTYTRYDTATTRNCPPAYLYYAGAHGTELRCALGGVVTTVVEGKPVSRIWWADETQTYTEYSTYSAPPSKAKQYQ